MGRLARRYSKGQKGGIVTKHSLYRFQSNGLVSHYYCVLVHMHEESQQTVPTLFLKGSVQGSMLFYPLADEHIASVLQKFWNLITKVYYCRYWASQIVQRTFLTFIHHYEPTY